MKMKKPLPAFSDRKKAVQHLLHSFMFFPAAFLAEKAGCVTLPLPVMRFPARVQHPAVP